MVESNAKHSDFNIPEKPDKVRIQTWVTPEFKQKVKDAVNKTHGDTIQDFINRSLEYTLQFPHIPSHLQDQIKTICEETTMEVDEFLKMSIEQSIADLTGWEPREENSNKELT